MCTASHYWIQSIDSSGLRPFLDYWITENLMEVIESIWRKTCKQSWYSDELYHDSILAGSCLTGQSYTPIDGTWDILVLKYLKCQPCIISTQFYIKFQELPEWFIFLNHSDTMDLKVQMRVDCLFFKTFSIISAFWPRFVLPIIVPYLRQGLYTIKDDFSTFSITK